MTEIQKQTHVWLPFRETLTRSQLNPKVISSQIISKGLSHSAKHLIQLMGHMDYVSAHNRDWLFSGLDVLHRCELIHINVYEVNTGI